MLVDVLLLARGFGWMLIPKVINAFSKLCQSTIERKSDKGNCCYSFSADREGKF
jgi:hypothetical protein